MLYSPLIAALIISLLLQALTRIFHGFSSLAVHAGLKNSLYASLLSNPLVFLSNTIVLLYDSNVTVMYLTL